MSSENSSSAAENEDLNEDFNEDLDDEFVQGSDSFSEPISIASDDSVLASYIDSLFEINTSPDSVAQLGFDLRQRFDVHRQDLRSQLLSLKDKAGIRRFSNAEVDQQLSLQHLPLDGEAGDGTFGQQAFVATFSAPITKDSMSPSYSSASVSVSEFIQKGHEKLRDWQQGSEFHWVHLPHNNFEWVYKTVSQLFKASEYKREVPYHVLKRELHTIRHGSLLKPGCRRTRVAVQERRRICSISFIMPYLHWERSLAVAHSTAIVRDALAVAAELRQCGSRGLLPTDMTELPCTVAEKMIRYHVPKQRGYAARRTLDQWRYGMTKSTDARDADQTVERYSNQEGWVEHRILMVDQMWLWILDQSKTIVLGRVNRIDHRR
jgi:hypothetical protein